MLHGQSPQKAEQLDTKNQLGLSMKMLQKKGAMPNKETGFIKYHSHLTDNMSKENVAQYTAVCTSSLIILC